MTRIIRYGSGPEQYGELRLPDNHDPRAIVVLIHGGFWRDQYHCDLMHPMADDLAARGWATWNIEYRRVGPTGGGWDTTTADVAAAIDHLPAIAATTGREWEGHAVIGHSAGGHLALWNASRAGAVAPRLSVGLAPVADVIAANRAGVGNDATTNFCDGNIDDVPHHYTHVQPDPQHFAGRVVLLHGLADEIVPIAQSDLISDHVDSVHRLDGVDHMQVIDPAHTSWRIVCAELAQLTRAPTTPSP